MPQNSNSFFFIQSKEGEFLRDYVAYFNTATLEMLNLNKFVAMLAMKKKLRLSRLTFFLNKKFPQSYSELLAHA